MLTIKGLEVKLEAEDKQILHGVDLNIGAGQVHAIMGPNGSGKSTLSYVLAGREGYAVTGGTATLNGADLLTMEPEDRAAPSQPPGTSVRPASRSASSTAFAGCNAIIPPPPPAWHSRFPRPPAPDQGHRI